MQAPTEFQGTVIGDLNKRKGIILNSETQGDDAIVDAQVAQSSAHHPNLLSVELKALGNVIRKAIILHIEVALVVI